MKVTAECIPCYLNQCLNAMEKGELPREKWTGILLELLPVISRLDTERTPAENSTAVLHKLVEIMGGADPFVQAKKESNKKALQYLDRLREMVQEAADPLLQAIKFAVAGNVVDLGLFDDYDLEAAVGDVLKTNFKRDDYPRFADDIVKAGKVLIIGDNSGEIVFDRLLVEVLQSRGLSVTYGVKGDFILNDATVEDAAEAGICGLCEVITNGNNWLGTVEDKCSEEFLRAMKDSDVIISKGQANYESLEGTRLAGNNTYFLLKAKCPVVAEHLGVGYGDVVFVKNGC